MLYLKPSVLSIFFPELTSTLELRATFPLMTIPFTVQIQSWNNRTTFKGSLHSPLLVAQMALLHQPWIAARDLHCSKSASGLRYETFFPQHSCAVNISQ